MGLLNYTVMEQPYTAAEILKNLDDDGQISGVIGISLDDIIENDMEGFDDILTERLVGLCTMRGHICTVFPGGKASLPYWAVKFLGSWVLERRIRRFLHPPVC